MPNFRQLKDKASGLGNEILKNPPVTYYFTTFFCPCLPSLSNVDIVEDILKIQETAKVLDLFYQVKEEEKFDVLSGLYILILRNYETRVKQLVYRPMITVLLRHLEVDCLKSISVQESRNALTALRDFIVQIHQNENLVEMQKIISVLPLQMLIDIRSHINLDETNDGSWSGTVADLINLSGINRLF